MALWLLTEQCEQGTWVYVFDSEEAATDSARARAEERATLLTLVSTKKWVWARRPMAANISFIVYEEDEGPDEAEAYFDVEPIELGKGINVG
jgi:hypothetical protein